MASSPHGYYTANSPGGPIHGGGGVTGGAHAPMCGGINDVAAVSNAAGCLLHDEADHIRCADGNRDVLVKTSLEALRAELTSEIEEDDWMYEAQRTGDGGGADRAAATAVALASTRSRSEPFLRGNGSNHSPSEAGRR